MEFFQVLSTPPRARAFNPAAAVSHEIVEKLTRAAERAPMCGPSRCWYLAVVRSSDGTQRIARSIPSAPQASVLFLFCADNQRAAALHATSSGHFADVDATSAATIAWVSAIALGLAVDWVTRFDARQVAQTLDLQPHLRPVVLLAIGYEQ